MQITAKLVGEVDTLEGKIKIQNDLDKLQKWFRIIQMKVSKGQIQSTALGMQQSNAQLQA